MKFADPSDIAEIFAEVQDARASASELTEGYGNYSEFDRMASLLEWKAETPPELMKFYRKRQRSKPRYKAYQAAYHAKDEARAKRKAWAKANPESNRESCRKYREKKRAAKVVTS